MLALNLFWFFSCQQGKDINSKNKSVLMESNPLNIVNKIAKTKPDNLYGISSFLDYTFKKDSSLTTNFIEVSVGTPKTQSQQFENVEVRFPLEGNKKGEILIKLNLRNGTTISKEMITSHFGEKTEIIVPKPNQKANPLVYWIYTLNDSRISFGFPNKGSNSLKTVIIKYIANS